MCISRYIEQIDMFLILFITNSTEYSFTYIARALVFQRWSSRINSGLTSHGSYSNSERKENFSQKWCSVKMLASSWNCYLWWILIPITLVEHFAMQDYFRYVYSNYFYIGLGVNSFLLTSSYKNKIWICYSIFRGNSVCLSSFILDMLREYVEIHAWIRTEGGLRFWPLSD